MTLQKEKLPDPVNYYESEDLNLQGKGMWRTTRCEFHGGSDSMRINTKTGGFVCMAACGARGGDVLAYHRAKHSMTFTEACKDLDAWTDDGTPLHNHNRPTKLSSSSLLKLAADDLTLSVMLMSDALAGKFKDQDLDQLIQVTSRIIFLSEVANG